MRFSCPGCKNMVSVEEEQRGTVVSCPECGKKLRVPAPKATSGVAKAPAKTAPKPPPAVAASSADDEPRPKKKSAVAEDDDDTPDDDEPKPRKKSATSEDEDPAEDEPRKKKKKRKKRRSESNPATTVGVFGGIGTLIIIGLFFYVLSGRWADNDNLRPVREFLEEKLGIHPLVAIGITACLGLIPFGIWMLFTTKSSVLAGMPSDMDFRPTKVEKFKDLDEDKLAEYTQAFEGLGFKQLMDYTVETELEWGHKGFARLMVNEEEHCFAEVSQAFIGDEAAIPMRCSLCTTFDDGWSAHTSDRTPSKESYMMRRPRGLWQSRPEDEPSDLFDAHMKLRKKMMRKLEIQVTEADTAQAYFQSEKRANRERKEAVQDRWTHSLLLDMWFFDRKPKYEWMGEMA